MMPRIATPTTAIVIRVKLIRSFAGIAVLSKLSRRGLDTEVAINSPKTNPANGSWF
jgi:hypothetical protein